MFEAEYGGISVRAMGAALGNLFLHIGLRPFSMAQNQLRKNF
jgi:hypothetical protein